MQELKPLETTNVELAQRVLSDLKISSITEERLKSSLVKIYLLVGLRQHHFPADEEKMFLHNFIFKNYGNKTISEFELAFNLAIKGELGITDTKVYDYFSCEYVAKIMNGYKSWLYSVSKNAELNKKNKLIEEKKGINEQEMIEWIEEWKKKEDINIDLIPISFYDFLTANKNITVTGNDKFDFLNKAAHQIKVQLQTKITELNFYKGSTVQANKDLSEFDIMAKDGFTGLLKDRITNRAKKLIVYNYLKPDVPTTN